VPRLTTTARDRPPEEAAEDSSFARGLRLLLTVADRGGVRADELAALLDMPVSTVYRYLRTLGEFGFVDRRAGRYHLGPRLMIGTQANVSSEHLIRAADPILQRLADETGETAVITRRIGLSAVCLHQVPSRHQLRVTLEPGEPLPLHAGATSRVLLAYAPQEIVEAVLAQGIEPATSASPGADALRILLAACVREGIAESEGELIPGAVALAAPILRPDGIVGAIGVIGPADRCGPGWRRGLRGRVRTAASNVAEALRNTNPL
jgi:DNA-binding IclR family transcriptional regulator